MAKFLGKKNVKSPEMTLHMFLLLRFSRLICKTYIDMF